MLERGGSWYLGGGRRGVVVVEEEGGRCYVTERQAGARAIASLFSPPSVAAVCLQVNKITQTGLSEPLDGLQTKSPVCGRESGRGCGGVAAKQGPLLLFLHFRAGQKQTPAMSNCIETHDLQ